MGITRYDGTYSDEWLLAGSPSGVRVQSLRALDVRSDTASLTTQVMVKAGTVPTLLGASLGIAGGSASILSSKVIAQTSGSSLTTTAPSTITGGTAVATVPLAILT